MTSIILAVECGGDFFSAAVNKKGVMMQLSSAEVKDTSDFGGDSQRHSSLALPLTRSVLEMAEVRLEDCDAFAFGVGPGRFSGLRMACALAQSFGYAKQRPVIAVPSLPALAYANYGADGENVAAAYAALPAHRGHAFLARCRFRHGRWRSARPVIAEEEDMIAQVRARHCCGAGFINMPQETVAHLLLSDRAKEPNAAAVAAIAAAMFADGETTSPLACAPLYVRHRVAKTVAERHH
ncbi:MAG: tRNA (adenosine(37)-N6)-threonylcarbamoyltransferase complex dimerization subunit type 1 TsaB [Gammaproteobacteria bacterium]